MKILPIQEYAGSKISDEEAIKRILTGEKALYELLMRRNNQKLYRVVAGYLKGHQEIADVMQETYLKAYEKLYQFKFKANFSTWLIRIGINQALIRLRQKSKYVHLNQLPEDKPNSVMNIPEQSRPDPEKKIIEQEARLMLELAISKLEPKYRIIYILQEVEGMSISEIQECLQISKSNVKVRLHRAKKMLKENLYNLSSDRKPFEFGFEKCDALVQKVLLRI